MKNCTTAASIMPTRRIGAASAFCLVLAAGCAIQSPFQLSGQLDYDASLITGERIFGEEVSPHEVPAVDITEPSDQMLDYVASRVKGRALASQRFRELFDGLTEDGYFEGVYSANRTLTAAETFEARGGNCLSYTSMFVALARAADLDASYQVVDVPPSWDADAGFLIRYTHINVLLEDVRVERGAREEVIIDFNIVQPDPDYPRRKVSDEYAQSLFYANQAVNLMRDNHPRQAFAYMRRAIDISPDNVDLWINLGAFYAMQQDYHSAIEAYQVALQLEPRNKAAYSGLARSYDSTGDEELAAVYQQKVRHYRERNPYYHYALAQWAFAGADFHSALAFIDQAIQLKRRTPRFHLLKGLVQNELGETDAARESLERAERYGLHQSVKRDLLRSLAMVGSS